MGKNIVIVGAGITGLSAGVYAARSGFKVTVIEGHGIAGGNCTSWKRGRYLFEGGMHWLTGSSESKPLNRLWRFVGALDDSVEIRTPEPFGEHRINGQAVKLFRDVEATERHWLELSPEDEAQIKVVTGNIRKVRDGQMPEFPTETREAFLSRFKHEGIRSLIRSLTSDSLNVVPLYFSMGIIATGDGGFPAGGSLPFVRRIVKTLEGLGGEIIFNTRVEKVLMESGKAVGVLAGGKEIKADAVIVTSDTMAADSLFDTPLHSDWLDKMRGTTEPTMNVLISLGIAADLDKYPKSGVWKLSRPLEVNGQEHEYLNVNNYAGDRDYSPVGTSALTVSLPGDNFDYWKGLKASGRYEEEKRKLGEAVAAALAEHMPEMDGKVEVCDVATPLTYERYCGNWKGSWMTEINEENFNLGAYPSFIEGMERLYFAGQRLIRPGGLPIALVTGRAAVEKLCEDTGTALIGEGFGKTAEIPL